MVKRHDDHNGAAEKVDGRDPVLYNCAHLGFIKHKSINFNN